MFNRPSWAAVIPAIAVAIAGLALLLLKVISISGLDREQLAKTGHHLTLAELPALQAVGLILGVTALLSALLLLVWLKPTSR
jgi:hypothetical protein